MRLKTRAGRCAATIVIAVALMALAATAFASSGDYGVNTGASAERSDCGGTGQPACTVTIDGYNATYRTTDSLGNVVYLFDDFDCFHVTAPSGTVNLFGTQCDQYQPSSS